MKFETSKGSLLPVYDIPFISKSSASGQNAERFDPGAFGGLTPISCPPQLVKSFAFDTFHISYHAVFNDLSIFDRMENSKFILQSGSDSEVDFSFTSNHDFSWNLQRSGKRFYPYVFRSGDLIFGINPNIDSDSTVPNVFFQVGSLSSHDISSVHTSFFYFMSLSGVDLGVETVSRFDICSDIAFDIKDTFTNDISLFIGRASKHFLSYSHRIFTGVQIGKGSIVARIYDKRQEMKDKRDVEKQIFYNDLWSDSKCPITRVEFQARRQAIKELLGSNTTIQNILNSSSNLWSYFVNKWLRQSSSPVDRKNRNQGQSIISDFWSIVQKSSSFLCRPSLRKKKFLTINIPDLRKQAVGCIMSCIAGLGIDYDDYFGVISTVTAMISDDVNRFLLDPFMKKRFYSKMISSKVTF